MNHFKKPSWIWALLRGSRVWAFFLLALLLPEGQIRFLCEGENDLKIDFSLLQNNLKIDLNCRDLHFQTFMETLMLPFNSIYYNAPEHPPPQNFQQNAWNLKTYFASLSLKMISSTSKTTILKACNYCYLRILGCSRPPKP